MLSPVVTATVLNSVYSPSQTGFITGALGLSNVQLISNVGLTYPGLDSNGLIWGYEIPNGGFIS
jgi:hypothetical protein